VPLELGHHEILGGSMWMSRPVAVLVLTLVS
jgi:hypothetical protein